MRQIVTLGKNYQIIKNNFIWRWEITAVDPPGSTQQDPVRPTKILKCMATTFGRDTTNEQQLLEIHPAAQLSLSIIYEYSHRQVTFRQKPQIVDF